MALPARVLKPAPSPGGCEHGAAAHPGQKNQASLRLHPESVLLSGRVTNTLFNCSELQSFNVK